MIGARSLPGPGSFSRLSLLISFGVPVMWEGFQPFTVMTEAPGAFLCLGIILGLMNWNTQHQARKRNLAVPENPLPGCGGCTACGAGRQGE